MNDIASSRSELGQSGETGRPDSFVKHSFPSMAAIMKECVNGSSLRRDVKIVGIFSHKE
jgi:hypothetical protein